MKQEIPIEIDAGKTVRIVIPWLSDNGWNDVGIQCSPEVWEKIARDANNIAVRLVSAGDSDTKIINVAPGGNNLWGIESYHYLFAIGGKYGTGAIVEIVFPSAPVGVTNAKIFVLQTPADTGL